MGLLSKYWIFELWLHHLGCFAITCRNLHPPVVLSISNPLVSVSLRQHSSLPQHNVSASFLFLYCYCGCTRESMMSSIVVIWLDIMMESLWSATQNGGWRWGDQWNANTAGRVDAYLQSTLKLVSFQTKQVNASRSVPTVTQTVSIDMDIMLAANSLLLVPVDVKGMHLHIALDVIWSCFSQTRIHLLLRFWTHWLPTLA